MRKFAPLPSDHPAVGESCGVCRQLLAAGDETTLVPKGKAEPGENLVESAVCHWQCVQEALAIKEVQEKTPFSVCPVCGLRSYNPNDIEQCYCGHCHAFHADLRNGVNSPLSDKPVGA